MKSATPNIPPAAQRTLQILDCFMADPAPKTMKMLSQQLDIPFTTVYRLVLCMQEYGYLSEDTRLAGHYRLGYKLSRFSEVALTEQTLIRIARPIMEEVSASLGQACQLCILTDLGVCTIEQTLPRYAMTYITELNETIPVNISASGKILTALLPEKKRARFLARMYPAFSAKTEYTITDPEEFDQVLKKTRSLGYGIDQQEYAIGIGCIAYPIFVDTEEPIAAIGATGPIDLYRDPAQVDNIRKTLYEASVRIASQISSS